LYGALREINPAPFAAWLQLPGFQVVSASPERFLRLGPDRIAESRPIKGTRPRGKDAAEDDRLGQDLANSAKDRAENVMIVDLVRNDLGRVAEIGSVAVPEMQVIEPYATVFQMVSTVQARLREDRDALDLVRACFPGGSMTGAPKIEAMKIIDALEPVKRGVYSGAIGYLDHSGVMDLSIVIRTIVCRDGRAIFGVGGAVVADSDPGAEYQETLDKAAALIAAVEAVAERGEQP
jgi:anthranilate/para-aminobenzoate synthase component I